MDEKTARTHFWRVGRSNGRSIYVQMHTMPRMTDLFVGMMDSSELALLVVNDHNQQVRQWLDEFRKNEKHLIPGGDRA